MENWEEVNEENIRSIANSIDFMIDNKNEDLHEYGTWVYTRWNNIVKGFDEEDYFLAMHVGGNLASEVKVSIEQANEFLRTSGIFSFKKKRAAEVLNTIARAARQVYLENEKKLTPFSDHSTKEN